MAGLELASDHARPIESHAGELAARLGLIALSVVATGLLWSTLVDDLLAAILGWLSPCGIECLSAYTPTDWVATRWLLIGLLGLLTSLPLAAHQVHAFIAPGTLPRERRLFRRLLVGSCVFVFLLLAVAWGWLLPATFAWADRVSDLEGVEARYDAVLLVNVALAVGWAIVIGVLAVLASELSGRLHLVQAANLDLWRLRLHGATSVLLWLGLRRASTDVALVTILVVIALADHRLRVGVVRAEAARDHRRGEAIMDHVGTARRVAVIDCACAGANAPADLGLLPATLATERCVALCRQPTELDALLDRTRIEGWTDLVITGCDATPTPAAWRRSLVAMDARARGLGLMDGPPAARTTAAADPSQDLRLALAGLSDPWPVEQADQRRRATLTTLAADGITRLRLISDQAAWHAQPPLHPDEVGLAVATEALPAWRAQVSQVGLLPTSGREA